ncbi:D-alanine--D-alanine ligase family protein [Saccharothrix syringae]|uniref:ATP-grasp domain-containing protein n=1 Tax=Saccharothrix syringae TaxID=103733 RepID=A0A5Q0H2N7_SACSY|nr:ATP-grasp domain-containing protein [Saccharothrix syringae]QFZ19952.1 ATP-grasp domain-containing protein [Saccharothrix syringae]
MSGLRVVVLRPAVFDPLNSWGNEECVGAVVDALTRSGVPAECRTVEDLRELDAHRGRPGLLAFPNARRLDGSESLIEALARRRIPFVGSSGPGMAVEDKSYLKRRLAAAGIPTPHGTVFDGDRAVEASTDGLRFPLVVKPVRGAESVGVAKHEDVASLRTALGRPGRFLIEEWHRHREFTVAVVGNGSALVAAPAEIVLPAGKDILDSDTKAHRITSTLVRADSRSATGAAGVALRAFDVLGLRDWARIDVVVDDDGTPYVIDVNTMPGLRREIGHPSYFPRCLAFSRGLDYDESVRALIAASALRHGLEVTPVLRAAHSKAMGR